MLISNVYGREFRQSMNKYEKKHTDKVIIRGQAIERPEACVGDIE